MAFGGGAFEGQYNFESRFEEGEGTNPEELIAAAHAGCFSMFLAGVLGEAGHSPESVRTTARVSVEKDGDGFSITRSELSTEVRAEGLGEEELAGLVDEAKSKCPVSRALGGLEMAAEGRLG